MKKYPVSKFSKGLFFAMLAFILPGVGFSISDLHDFVRAYQSGSGAAGFLLTPVLVAIGIADLIYLALRDMPFARFSVSKEGITESMGFKKYYHAWAEFEDYGILGVNVEHVMGTPVADTYWVYFSTSILNAQERKRFLRRTRKDLTRIAFFQYSTSRLNEILMKGLCQILGWLKKEVKLTFLLTGSCRFRRQLPGIFCVY